ncbi:MAG: type IX secretion system sortase PorU [Bacteroidota bacterium]|nr:type IX secretion system sortase PorU [Bacteroidota bacterium]
MYRKIGFVIIGILLVAFVQAQRSYAAHSVLASGTWYKIAVTGEGIYKIDLPFLQKMGINTTNLSSSSIRLYGNGGGMLPENNAIRRADDLVENAIEVFDGGDGVINGNDYLLFYAQGPDHWDTDSIHRSFHHQKNLYSDSAYYFLTVGGNGKRIAAQMAGTLVANTNVTSYDEHIFYEKDLVNLLSSGKQWLGEELSATSTNGYNKNFTATLPGLLLNEPLNLTTSVVARSVGAPAAFSMLVNGQQVQKIDMPAVSGYFLDAYASSIQQATLFSAGNASLTLTLQYNATASGAQGWLDWWELLGRCTLSFTGQSQLFFRDWRSVAPGHIANFSIGNTSTATEVWDITDVLHPVKMNTAFLNGQTSFSNEASVLHEYVAFAGSSFNSPAYVGTVATQDLHATSSVDYLIITTPAFMTQANRLADFHRQHNGYTVGVVTTDKIYNEFSDGIPDPTALRDYVKMFYDKSSSGASLAPKYLLLLGAASYDYKNRIANNTNWVPCYESPSSLDPLTTFTSDDYFGLLGDSDDINRATGTALLDIGVGRLPARTIDDATVMVDKIIHYHASQSLGSWRNESVYVADDKDNDLHVQDAEGVSAIAAAADSILNPNKIYLDAYPLVSGGGGGRYPDVNTAIVNKIQQGVLYFNYNGHGGYQRLADEAILGTPELQQFNNADKLPLFITATCDFAPYDDPAKNAIGGQLLYGDATGAIALMTTTRVVFAYSNRIMNDNYLQVLLQRDAQGNYPTLGDAVRTSKNLTYRSSGDVINNRKFTLLGDPAMRLAFPSLQMQLTAINGHAVNGSDTLQALNTYTMSGIVTDASGNIQTQFNGTVYPVLYDKPQLVSTLGNDPASPVMQFSQQSSILYKGRATVTNGRFSFSFVVPKDINYKTGKGKLSLYAENGTVDAAGASRAFWIGGVGNTVIADTSGPLIKAYLNDTLFVNGNVTNNTPLLLVKLFDRYGINTSGTGIGHDITAMLDSDANNMMVLNTYYQAALDSYQGGWVSFQLPLIKPGKHTLTIKAWNVANYSSTIVIRFEVLPDNASPRIIQLFNYPNPASAGTTFRFQHNLPGSNLDVRLVVYTASGQQVYQKRTTMPNTLSKILEMYWDFREAGGKKLQKGLYFYRIIVSSNSLQAQAAQRLIIY